MKPRYVITPDKFEAYDGGHCYIRATRDHENKIEITRYPTRACAETVAKLGDWAAKKTKPYDECAKCHQKSLPFTDSYERDQILAKAGWGYFTSFDGVHRLCNVCYMLNENLTSLDKEANDTARTSNATN